MSVYQNQIGIIYLNSTFQTLAQSGKSVLDSNMNTDGQIVFSIPCDTYYSAD